MEKENTPSLKLLRRQKLSQKITIVTEDLEKLRSEKVLLLSQCNCLNEQDIMAVKERIVSMDASLEKLDQQEVKYAGEIETALAQYADLQQQATDVDIAELNAARLSIRADKERELVQRLKAAYGKQLDFEMLAQSRKKVEGLLGESTARKPVKSLLQRQAKTCDHRHQKSFDTR